MNDSLLLGGMLVKLMAAALTALIPGFLWLGQKIYGFSSRIERIETSREINDPLFIQMQADHRVDRERLVTVEQTTIRLADLQLRTDAHYKEMTAKLEYLPRIDESLKGLARICATIVPRDEWELNNRLYDERLKRNEEISRK